MTRRAATPVAGVAEAIVERLGVRPDALPADACAPTQPMVLRGLVGAWPMVQAARESAEAGVRYLQRFVRRNAPATATVGPPGINGRFFYDDTLRGFNFRREQVPLDVVLQTLLNYRGNAQAPAIYVASTTIDTFLPGFRAHNDLPLDHLDALASIWIGNRSRIAAHQDVPDNIACVIAGRRRVTLFPPDQLQNLYVGPLDQTPAGQPVSLVDLHAPDLEHFPRFEQAMRHAQVAVLEPGDAVVIPSMWWHHMEGLDDINALVNYWWRQSPAWMDTPMNALMLAIMSVRDLPPAQRDIWRDVFAHYVFGPGDATDGHIPPQARGVLAPMDEDRVRTLRDKLLQRLKR